MKYYETHYEDYINSVEKYDMHPEMKKIYDRFPKNIAELENIIIYGPCGSGKYSQVLSLLKKYSPSELKYDKKITANTEKQNYIYRISDIHYEVDMSLLGCNSKLLWHEIFFQIVDIITVKPDKQGVILCKNFHLIHGELLEIFYSYMQQYNHSQSNIKIIFIIITEHISFLPTPIINSCQTIQIKRPSKDKYIKMLTTSNTELRTSEPLIKKINEKKSATINKTENILKRMNEIDTDGILNAKELKSFPFLENIDDMPKDIFNIICDNIIKEILQETPLSFTGFRDTLYDILTYNLDVSECIWYILSFFVKNNHLSEQDVTDILQRAFTFLKYYNNNYRPIYHLESIMYYIITKIKKFNEL